mgnify:CR=1 FL=1
MGYTIAICDDDKAMADKLTASLKNEFMKAGRNDVIIDYYDTGVQLLEALKNKMYKAVLLDINMEPMDGEINRPWPFFRDGRSSSTPLPSFQRPWRS